MSLAVSVSLSAKLSSVVKNARVPSSDEPAKLTASALSTPNGPSLICSSTRSWPQAGPATANSASTAASAVTTDTSVRRATLPAGVLGSWAPPPLRM